MHLNETGQKKPFFVERKPKSKEEIGAGKRNKGKNNFDKYDPAFQIPDSATDIKEYLEENNQ